MQVWRRLETENRELLALARCSSPLAAGGASPLTEATHALVLRAARQQLRKQLGPVRRSLRDVPLLAAAIHDIENQLQETDRGWAALMEERSAGSAFSWDRLERSLSAAAADFERVRLVLEEQLRRGRGERRPETSPLTPATPSDIIAGSSDPWAPPPSARRQRELERYQKDRPLPGFEEECARYFRELSRRRNEDR
jgi:hypothetical protein